MTKVSLALGALAVLAAAVGGWAFLTSDMLDRGEVTQPQPNQDGKEKTLDDLLIEVAKRVPGFGGMFVSEEGRLTVYLLDPTQGPAAEAAIAAVFGPERISPGGVRVLQGQYSFPQLKQWHDRMGALFEVSGVVLTDIGEADNRLTVGLERMDKRGLVEQRLDKLGIPRAAVEFEETGPIVPVRGAR